LCEALSLTRKDKSRDFCSAEELRQWLGLGRTKIFELLNSPGGIPHYRIGRRIIIRRQEVLAWLEEHRYRLED
jgi:excisionase family DNA binding protein